MEEKEGDDHDMKEGGGWIKESMKGRCGLNKHSS